MVMKNLGLEKKSGSSRFDCKFCKINLPSFDIKFHVFSQLVNSIPIPGGDSAVDQLDAIPVVCIVLLFSVVRPLACHLKMTSKVNLSGMRIL